MKELEEKGIGRPSTYAAIISTIVEREYVNKDQGRFTPTLLGEKVSELLVKAFEDIFDVGFTARLEDELDEIEEGKLTWRTAVKEFWDRFARGSRQSQRQDGIVQGGHSHRAEVREVRRGRTARTHQPPRIFPGLLALSGLRFHSRSRRTRDSRQRRRSQDASIATTAARKWPSSAGASARSLRAPAIRIARRRGGWRRARRRRCSPTCVLDEKCPDVRRAICCAAHGRFGEFIGCKNYPKCKYTRPITLGIKCPKCNEGEFVRRGTAKGRGARTDFLRLQPLSRLRFHHAARADRRALPEMRRAVCGREAHEAGKFPRVHQRKLRLGNCRAGAPPVPGGAVRSSAKSASAGAATGRAQLPRKANFRLAIPR